MQQYADNADVTLKAQALLAIARKRPSRTSALHELPLAGADAWYQTPSSGCQFKKRRIASTSGEDTDEYSDTSSNGAERPASRFLYHEAVEGE